MNKKYSKKEMVTLLSGLHNHFKEHEKDFPGLVGVIAAMKIASKNLTSDALTQLFAEVKVPAKTKPAPRSVNVSYQEDSIVVSNVPWGKAYYALCRIMGIVTGRTVTNPGEYFGQPVFKSCYDKRSKSYKLPIDKAAEVLDFFKAEGIPVMGAK